MREHCKSGRSPAAQQFLMHFEVKTALLLAFVLNSFWSRERLQQTGQLFSVAVSVLARLVCKDVHVPYTFACGVAYDYGSNFNLISVGARGPGPLGYISLVTTANHITQVLMLRVNLTVRV